MNNSNLLSILGSLSPSEIKQFGKFLNSPFLRNNHHRMLKIRKLYSEMKRYFPNYVSREIDWTKIFRKVYPNENFDTNKMRGVVDELVQLSEEYLSYLNYKKSNFQIKINLLNQLKARKLDNLFQHNLCLLKKEVNNSRRENTDFLFQKYLLSDMADV